jgi:hypothetical protein
MRCQSNVAIVQDTHVLYTQPTRLVIFSRIPSPKNKAFVLSVRLGGCRVKQMLRSLHAKTDGNFFSDRVIERKTLLEDAVGTPEQRRC